MDRRNLPKTVCATIGIEIEEGAALTVRMTRCLILRVLGVVDFPTVGGFLFHVGTCGNRSRRVLSTIASHRRESPRYIFAKKLVGKGKTWILTQLDLIGLDLSRNYRNVARSS